MFLIPLGHEHETTRRIPWVTFGILALCLAAFALTGFGSWNSSVKAAERNEQALTYFMEHPYLKLTPEAEHALFGEDAESTGTALEALRANHPVPGNDVVRREQMEFDRMMAAAFGSASADPYARFGLVPADPAPLAWVTHLFMHVGWLHLLGNLFLLYLLGPFLEDVWGRPLFAGFYVASGLVAAAAFAFTYRSLEAPLVGASGAIAGCMGAFLVRYGRARVQFFYVLGFWRSGTFWAPAWLMLGLWFADQVFLSQMAHGATTTGADGGVAYLAHVGGFAFGAIAAFGLSRARAEERVAPRLEAKINRPVLSRPVLERALEARERGHLDAAISLLRQNLAENPGDRDTVLALWEAAVIRGTAAEVAPALKGVVRSELRDGQVDLAAQHWVELIRVAPTMTLDTGSLLRMVPPLAEAGRKEDAAAVLRRALLTAGTNLPSATALRMAGLAAPLDPRLATSVLKLVLARPSLDPSERLQAERALAAVAEPAAMVAPAVAVAAQETPTPQR